MKFNSLNQLNLIKTNKQNKTKNEIKQSIQIRTKYNI